MRWAGLLASENGRGASTAEGSRAVEVIMASLPTTVVHSPASTESALLSALRRKWPSGEFDKATNTYYARIIGADGSWQRTAFHVGVLGSAVYKACTYLACADKKVNP